MVPGRDEYLDGAGSIVMKMLGLVSVADETGARYAAAGLMRYLNETMWFPAALLGDNVTIAAVDDASFDVTLTDRGMGATGRFFVDAEGRPVNFSAPRYDSASATILPWETPLTGYGERAGVRLPLAGSAHYRRAIGDFTYIELAVDTVEYDPAP